MVAGARQTDGAMEYIAKTDKRMVQHRPLLRVRCVVFWNTKIAKMDAKTAKEKQAHVIKMNFEITFGYLFKSC